MDKYVLGIDIADNHIAAALVGQQGSGVKQLVSLLHAPNQLNGELPDFQIMFDEITLRDINTVIGLPLSCLSLRNLFLPFIDSKQINQTLSFELEEQLITPIEQLRFQYSVSKESDEGSKILVASLHKEILNQYVNSLERNKISPMRICPGAPALAEQLFEFAAQPEKNVIYLDTSVSSADLILFQDDKVLFMRQLIYPDSLLVNEPFSFINNEALVTNQESALSYITYLCQAIERNISYFQHQSDMPAEYNKMVISGILASDDFFTKTIGQQLHVEVEVIDFLTATAVEVSETAANSYCPAIHDRALGLAMQGFQKSSTINFFKDDLSPLFRFVGNKKQLTLALGALGIIFALIIGYLGFTHSTLQTSYDLLDVELRTIYRETFPNSTLRTKPYEQMQSKLKELRDPSDGVPIFPTEKRTLNILADISSRISKKITINVNRLIIDQESVRVKGNTGTFNDVNDIKSSLEESDLYESVDILSASADNKKNNIRFELKLQLMGEN